MSTHSVSSLDSGRLLQCVATLVLAFAGITSFDPSYWFTYTIPLALAGVALFLLPCSLKFQEIIQGKLALLSSLCRCSITDGDTALDNGKKMMPSGPNHREKKAEKKAERGKAKKAARESASIRPVKGRPSEAQIELIKKEQDRRLNGGRPRGRSVSGRAETS